MSADVVSLIISGIVGVAGTTFISQLIRARNSLRSGARASTRAVVKDMAEDRRQAEERTEHQTRLTEFWRATAANYLFQLRSNGITPDPEHPIPPEAAVRGEARARRKVSEIEDTLADVNGDDKA